MRWARMQLFWKRKAGKMRVIQEETLHQTGGMKEDKESTKTHCRGGNAIPARWTKVIISSLDEHQQVTDNNYLVWMCPVF